RRWTHGAELRRNAVHRKPGKIQRSCKGTDRGDWRQDRKVLQGLRSEAVFEDGHGGVLRQGNLWRRPSGYRHEHDAMAGISWQSAPLRYGAKRHRARLHRKEGLSGGNVRRRKNRTAEQDKLRGILDEALQA